MPRIFVIRERQIKTTMKYHYMPSRTAKFRIFTTPHTDSDANQQELSYIAGGNSVSFIAKWYSHLERQFDNFLKK